MKFFCFREIVINTITISIIIITSSIEIFYLNSFRKIDNVFKDGDNKLNNENQMIMKNKELIFY